MIAMRKSLLTTVFFTQLIGHCMAGLGILPEIPIPKLAVEKVLSIANQTMRPVSGVTDLTLVGIDWCKSSEFKPRFSAGNIAYTPGQDHPDEYSWFLTYVSKDERLPKASQISYQNRFNSVNILRIKDDGQIGVFIGIGG